MAARAKLNALAWVLSLVGALDAAALCGDDLAAQLPDLRRSEPIGEWLERSSVNGRADEEVIAEWDLHFCLTWGLAEANLRGDSAPGALPQYVYWQRRRAYEFVCATDTQHGDWDDIDLST